MSALGWFTVALMLLNIVLLMWNAHLRDTIRRERRENLYDYMVRTGRHNPNFIEALRDHNG